MGGDVDSNPMDSRIVVSMCGWILAEMIRVLHGLSILEAQKVVDFISERKIPLVWEKGGVKRVLDPKIGISDQVILLVASKT